MTMLNHIPPVVVLIGLVLTTIFFGIMTAGIISMTIGMFQEWKGYIKKNGGTVPIMSTALAIIMLVCLLILVAFITDFHVIVDKLQLM